MMRDIQDIPMDLDRRHPKISKLGRLKYGSYYFKYCFKPIDHLLIVFFSFQNLDDGDIRDLGVGYYNFSADESTRQQQMSLLDTLRYVVGSTYCFVFIYILGILLNRIVKNSKKKPLPKPRKLEDF